MCLELEAVFSCCPEVWLAGPATQAHIKCAYGSTVTCKWQRSTKRMKQQIKIRWQSAMINRSSIDNTARAASPPGSLKWFPLHCWADNIAQGWPTHEADQGDLTCECLPSSVYSLLLHFLPELEEKQSTDDVEENDGLTRLDVLAHYSPLHHTSSFSLSSNSSHGVEGREVSTSLNKVKQHLACCLREILGWPWSCL